MGAASIGATLITGRYLFLCGYPKVRCLLEVEMRYIANKYNNAYDSTIKLKYVDIKLNTYFDSIKEVDHKDLKFEIGHIVRISKFNIFAKGYVAEIVGTFYEKKFQNLKWV